MGGAVLFIRSMFYQTQLSELPDLLWLCTAGLCQETEAVEAVLREAEPPSVHWERVATLEGLKGAAEGHIQQLNNEKR